MFFKADPTLVALYLNGITSVAVRHRHGVENLYVVLAEPTESALIYFVVLGAECVQCIDQLVVEILNE